MHTNDRIDEYIESQRDALVEDICTLIRIPSVVDEDALDPSDELPYGRDAADVVDKFQVMMEGYGLTTKNVDYRAVYGSYGPGPRGLDLLVHVDIVGAADDWTVTEPFDPVVRCGRIYGRGSADDKGPAVAALYAIKALRDLGIKLEHGVRLVAGSNEENGGHEDIRYYHDIEGTARCTVSPDGEYPIVNIEKGFYRGRIEAAFGTPAEGSALVSFDSGTKRWVIPGEASAKVRGLTPEEIKAQLEDVSARTGVAFETSVERDFTVIRAKGTESHVGAPLAANSGLTALLELVCALPLAPCEGIERMRALCALWPHGDWKGSAAGIAQHEEDSGDLLCVLNILHYTQDGLWGSFDSKLPARCRRESVAGVLEPKLAAAAGLELSNIVWHDAHYVPLDSPLASCLLGLYGEYTGNDCYGVSIEGKSYVFGQENAVTFGCAMPGVDNRMHLGDEFAEIDVLVMSAKIMAHAIMELCGVSEG